MTEDTAHTDPRAEHENAGSQIDRRTFMKGSLAAGGGLAALGLAGSEAASASLPTSPYRASQGQGEVYLSWDDTGIVGGVQQPGREGDTDVVNYEWFTGERSTGRDSRATSRGFFLELQFDRATPVLYEVLETGRTLGSVTVNFIRGNDQGVRVIVHSIELQTVNIRSIQLTNASPFTPHTVVVEFVPERVVITDSTFDEVSYQYEL